MALWQTFYGMGGEVSEVGGYINPAFATSDFFTFFGAILIGVAILFPVSLEKRAACILVGGISILVSAVMTAFVST